MLINFLIRLICTYQNVLDIGLSKENHTISKFHAPFITLIKSFPELNKEVDSMISKALPILWLLEVRLEIHRC